VITLPVTRELTRPLTRALTDAGAGDLAAAIRALFANGEQGGWYDPSDMSTMYQDAAGTTPCYQPGQGQVDPPVGLLLDKRLGLARGPEKFTDPSVVFSGESSRVSAGVYRLYSSAGAYSRINLTPSALVAGRWYELVLEVLSVANAGAGMILEGADSSISVPVYTTVGVKRCIVRATTSYIGVKRSGGSIDLTLGNVSVRELPGNHAYQTTTTSRPTLSARYNLLTATDTLTTQSVTTVATSYTLKLTGAGSVTLSGTAAGSYSAGTYTITCTAGSLTLTVSGSVTQADLRIANDGVGLPPYQRVVDANTYDTVGFPPYLKFDGVDDFLQTASVDFSATNKIFVGVGARKLADTGTGLVLELSTGTGAGNPGSFALYSSPNAAAQVGAIAYMTGLGYKYAPISAPANYVQSVQFDASLPVAGQMDQRINKSAVVALSGGDMGAGNFGNYAMYMGRRGAGGSLFAGRISQVIVCGKRLSAAEINAVEKLINSKVRAY